MNNRGKFKVRIVRILLTVMALINLTSIGILHADEQEILSELSEDAIIQAMTASQFVKPFSNALYNVLEDQVIKSASEELLGEDGKPKPITHTPLLVKNGEDNYGRAVLKDLFTVSSNGDTKEFYVEYEYEEEEEGEDGETEIVTITDYIKVFYGNNNSNMYLSLFAAYDDLVKDAIQNRTMHPLDIDMYGNIVLDDEKNKGSESTVHHYMVIPAIVNPMMFDDDMMYIPTRKFNSVYQYSLTDLITSSTEFTSKDYKKRVGSKLGSQEVAVYNIDNTRVNPTTLYSLFNKTTLNKDIPEEAGIFSSGPLSPYVGDYFSYLGIDKDGDKGSPDPSNQLMIVFGPGYQYRFANRFQSRTHLYLNLAEIMASGVKNPSSAALLPKDRVYLGRGDMKYTQYQSTVADGKIKDGGTYEYFYPSFTSLYSGKSLGASTSWGTGFTEEEYKVTRKLTSDFVSGNITLDNFKIIDVQSTNSQKENASPSDTSNTTPQSSHEGRITNIIARMDALLGKPGTSLAAISSSRLSKEYSNMNTTDNENLLFNATGVLANPAMLNIMLKYIRITIYVATLLMLINIVKYVGKDVTELPKYALTTIKSIAYCLLPVLVITTTIGVCNKITEKVFTTCYTYWTIGELESIHTMNDTMTDINRETEAYFKELNTMQSSNRSSVNLKSPADIDAESIVSLTSKLRREDSLDEVVLMANLDLYGESIFYYFYDTLRLHLSRYYEDEILDGMTFPDWSNERGLIQSKGKLRDMVTDVGFLFGNTISEEDHVEALSNEKYLEKLTLNNEVQDILGLTHLFTRGKVFERDSYYSMIADSNWMRIIENTNPSSKGRARGKAVEVKYDSNYYDDGIIYGSKTYGKSEGVEEYSDFEESLHRVNKVFAKNVQVLTDYSKMYSDETLLIIAALEATFAFNQEMNGGKILKTVQRAMHIINNPNPDTLRGVDLYPLTYNGGSYTMDTVLKGIFFESITTPDAYSGDLIHYIENKGGIIMQSLIIILIFVSQIAGIAKLFLFLIIFILAVFTFTFAYNLRKDFWNQAWLGLLSLVLVVTLVHWLYLTGVSSVSQPVYANIGAGMFGSLQYNLKVVALLVLAILQIVATGFILLYAFKHWRDLGGAMVSASLAGMVGYMTGSFMADGDFHSDNNYSDRTEFNGDNEIISEEESSIVDTENMSTTHGDNVSDTVNSMNLDEGDKSNEDSFSFVGSEANEVVIDEGGYTDSKQDTSSSSQDTGDTMGIDEFNSSTSDNMEEYTSSTTSMSGGSSTDSLINSSQSSGDSSSTTSLNNSEVNNPSTSTTTSYDGSTDSNSTVSKVDNISDKGDSTTTHGAQQVSTNNNTEVNNGSKGSKSSTTIDETGETKGKRSEPSAGNVNADEGLSKSLEELLEVMSTDESTKSTNIFTDSRED